MPDVKPRTMSGALELLPRDQIAFQRLLDAIRRSYERFGFLPVETPAMEYVDVLLSKSGGDTAKQIYFVQSKGARDQGREPELALRFDLTVPLARYVAEHEGELAFPFRRYQIQRVYRGENVQRGRYREFYQCDLDVVGKGELSLQFDAEIPTVIYHTFREIHPGRFTVQLNNRKVLWGLLEDLGVEGDEAQAAVLREIDKLDRRGHDAVAATLAEERFGLGEAGTRQLLQTLCRTGGNQEMLAGVEALGGRSRRLREGLEELHALLRALADFEVPEEAVRVNLAIARGLDYYTGTVYETLLLDHPELGSVCSGGRYENLASQYTQSVLPGVGASIGATRLFYQLRELGLVERQYSTVQVLVTQLDAALAPAYRRLAAQLRAAGINTELYHEAAKIGKQLRHADRAGIPLAVILGPEEEERGAVMLKDLVAGTQEEVPAAELAAAARRALSGAP